MLQILTFYTNIKIVIPPKDERSLIGNFDIYCVMQLKLTSLTTNFYSNLANTVKKKKMAGFEMWKMKSHPSG